MIFGSGVSGGMGTGIVFTLHNNFSATANKIGADWKRLETTTDKATAKITRSLNGMRAGLKGLLVGAILLAPVLMGVSKSMEFNAVMSEVYAKSATTNIAIQKQLASESMRLGEATKFSAKQVAEGQAFLAMAGFKTTAIISAMPGVLNLAAAGNLDLARSADIASNILTAMGLKAKDMGRVADVLALAATSANVSVEMLGDTFAYAAASAKGLNWSLEQTAAMSGMLGNIGIQGSSAGTAIMNFNRFLTKLNPEKIAKLGLRMSDIVDQSGNLKDVPLVFAKIMNSVKDLGNFKRANLLNQLFGPRGNKAIAAFNAAMESGFDFTSYITKLEGASGASQRIANQMMNNLKGDLIILKSVWETTLIKIGNSAEAAFRPLVQGVTKAISFFGKLAQSPIGKWVIKLTMAVGGLIIALSTLRIVIALVKLPAAQAALAFQAMGKSQIAATFATKGLVSGLMAVTKAAIASLAVMWPYLLIGVVLAGVIMLVRKSLKSFNDVLNGAAEPAKGFMGFMQKLGGILKAVGEIWKSANSEGFTMSEQLAVALKKLGILNFAISVGTWIVRIKMFFIGLGQGLKAAWNSIKPIFKLIGSGIKGLGKIFDKFGFNMRKNQSDVGKWTKAGKTIGIMIMATLVPAFASLAISVIAATWPILAIIAAIAGVIAIVKNWSKISAWFKSIWGETWEFITENIDKFIVRISIFNTKIKNFGTNLVLNLKDGIASAWQSFSDWLHGLFEKLFIPIEKALELFGVTKDINQNVNVEGGINNDGAPKPPSELAVANAQNKAAQFSIPGPVVLQNNNTTEVLRTINIDMDGKEIRHDIDIGTEEDLNRQ